MDQFADLFAHQNSALPTALAEDLDGVMVDIDIGTIQFLSPYSTAHGDMDCVLQSPLEISSHDIMP